MKNKPPFHSNTTAKVLGHRNNVTNTSAGYVKGIQGVPGQSITLPAWQFVTPLREGYTNLHTAFFATT